ncbi:LysR family transcriptional regulator [Maricurvus nonylphenolicus]|uniref:LysR family transcriptional regulator n=1 Tax=Maricurvus nonylphenolicus TaxID=1008307 RepID=UPI0036F28716
MKLQQLRYFVAVYEMGSITAGAERANATQSGISMQIKDLEERLGGPLFERNAGGVIATTLGRRFYDHATAILRRVTEAEQDIKSLAGEVTGELRIGLMPTFTRSILPPALIRFSEQYPLVKTRVIEAYSAQLTREVIEGELDFAIVPSEAHRQGEMTRNQFMASDQEFLVSAAGQPFTHMQAVDLSELEPLKLVLPGPENARRAKIDAYLKTHNIKVEAIMELDAMLGTLELVAHSEWKTILPGILCKADESGLARQINPLNGAPLKVDYMMIEPNDSCLSPGASLFSEMLKQELESQIHWHNLD